MDEYSNRTWFGCSETICDSGCLDKNVIENPQFAPKYSPDVSPVGGKLRFPLQPIEPFHEELLTMRRLHCLPEGYRLV